MILKSFVFGLLWGLSLGYTYICFHDVFGVLLGSLISLIISKHYYTKAAEDLKEETMEVRSTLSIALLKLQNPADYRVFLKDGKIKAELNLTANLTGSSKVVASLDTHEKG